MLDFLETSTYDKCIFLNLASDDYTPLHKYISLF